MNAITSEFRPQQAEALLDAVLDRIETLEAYPLRGAVPKELEAIGLAEFRQVLVSPYRLIYRVEEDVVFVLVIADGRRDMQALLQQRLLLK